MGTQEIQIEQIGHDWADARPVVAVQLIGGFRVSCGPVEVDLPASTRRLIAFLALQRRFLERSYVANCLWLDKNESRAQANLRCSLWRLRQCGIPLVEVTPTHLRLNGAVVVDLADAVDLASRLVNNGAAVTDQQLDPSILAADLLPEWYDDFVEVERERLRQLRFHALEALARRLHGLGEEARALDVALTVVALDPLRESAHRAVIELHLAEGNVSEALRQYRLVRQILDDELGVEPSSAMLSLVAPYVRRSPASVAASA